MAMIASTPRSFFAKSFFCAVLAACSIGLIQAGDKVSPVNIDGATTVDTSAAKALFDEGVLFVDVRKDSDWQAGRIPDAVHLELKKVYTQASLGEEATVNDKLVVYCNGPSCLRSSKAAVQAVGWGYKQVYYYREGFPAWKGASLPVE